MTSDKISDASAATVRQAAPGRTRDIEPSMPSYDCKDLFLGGKEIALLLEGAVYRLRITRQGKLILNK